MCASILETSLLLYGQTQLALEYKTRLECGQVTFIYLMTRISVGIQTCPQAVLNQAFKSRLLWLNPTVSKF